MRLLRIEANRIDHGRRGQSLVELAMMLPLVTFLMMGVADLGFVLYAHVQVASAAGEAARVAAHYNPDSTLSNLAATDNARLGVVKKAVYDSSTTPATTSLGRLRTNSPYFNIGSYTSYASTDDVWIDKDSANSSGLKTRRGEEIVVNVRYREPVLFGVIPGLSSMRFTVSSSARVRIP